MLRLGPAQVGVLRPDDGIVHRPAQVRRHIAPGKPGDRTIPPGGQLTPHFQLRDVLPGQKAGRRAAVRLQHRPQQVAGVCLFAAHVQARIPKVVIGAMNPKAGCAGSVLNILQIDKFNHQVEIERGILEEECSQMLSDFFKELRRRKKGDKEHGKD